MKNYDRDYLTFKSGEFGESELITRLLLNRGINSKEEVEKFLNSSENDLLNPFLLENMDEVTERILKAKKKQRKNHYLRGL